jgi:hypothetical protein
MIGRMIAPAAQMMLLYRPKFKFLRFQMTVNTDIIRRYAIAINDFGKGAKPVLILGSN